MQENLLGEQAPVIKKRGRPFGAKSSKKKDDLMETVTLRISKRQLRLLDIINYNIRNQSNRTTLIREAVDNYIKGYGLNMHTSDEELSNRFGMDVRKIDINGNALLPDGRYFGDGLEDELRDTVDEADGGLDVSNILH
jgi:hypothetical protein